MSDPDRKSDAAVFLVGLDIDGTAFAEFCRLNLIDFLAEQVLRRDTAVTAGGDGHLSRAPSPPFFTFLLKSPADSEADRLPEFEMLIGHWPRIFSRREDVRDALYDTIANDLEEQQDISIVILTKRPSDLSAHFANGLITKLDDVFAERQAMRTRFWIMGVLLSGPNVDKADLTRLLVGPGHKLQTIFLLESRLGSIDASLTSRNRSFEKLRFVVDLARNGGDGRRALRPLHGSQPGTLYWLANPDDPSAMRSKDILGYVKTTLRVLKSGKEDIEYEELNSKIESIRQKIAPDEGMPPDTVPKNCGGDLLEKSDGYRASALQKIDSFERKFYESLDKIYAGKIEDIKKFVIEEDNHRVKRLKEIRSEVENLIILDGGYSNQSQGVIRGHIESFREYFRSLGTRNKETRAKFDKTGTMLSKFIKLATHGDLRDTDSDEFRSYIASITDARTAAGHLPYNVWTFVAIATLPVISFLLATVSHAIAQDDVRNLASVTMNFFDLHGDFLSICAILSAFLLPIVIALCYHIWYSNMQKKAFAQVRKEADSIMVVVSRAVNETRLYARYARAALLNREAARILESRLATDAKTKVASQAEEFLRRLSPRPIEAEDTAEIWEIAGHWPENELFRRIVANGLQMGDAKEWLLEIGSGEAVTAVKTDKSANRDAPITISSAWLSSSVHILARPLQLQGEEETSDDMPPSANLQT